MIRRFALWSTDDCGRLLGKKRRRNKAIQAVVPFMSNLVRSLSVARRIEQLTANSHYRRHHYFMYPGSLCVVSMSSFSSPSYPDQTAPRQVLQNRYRQPYINSLRSFSSDSRSESQQGRPFEIWPWDSIHRFSHLSLSESISLLKSVGDEDAQSLLERPVGSLTVHECTILQKALIKGGELARVEDEQGLRNENDNETDLFNDGRVDVRRRVVSPRKTHHEDDWPFLVDILHQGWMILDRLAAELLHQSLTVSKHSTSNQQESELKTAFWEAIVKKPLAPWVLQTWRKVLLHCYRNKVENVDVNSLPSPTMVQQKLKVYLETGIFIWTPHLVSFILDVLPLVVHNNQEAAFLAHHIYDSLVQYPQIDESPYDDDALTEEPSNIIGLHPKEGSGETTRLRNDQKFVPEVPRYPDRVLVSRLLGIWHKSGHISAPQQAMKLLSDLNDLHALYGLKRHQPDIHVYTGAIFCWAKTPKFIQRTAHLTNSNYDEICVTKKDFDRLERETSSVAGPVTLQLLQEANKKHSIVPNGIMFEGVVESLARSSDQRYLNHAIRLFDERANEWFFNLDNPGMKRNFHARLKPSTEAISAIVYKLVRTGQTHQATRLMNRMEKLAIDTNEKSIAPTDFCFDEVRRSLLRKVQAHGSSHDKYTLLQWDNKNQSGASWERETVATWRNIDSEIKRSIASLGGQEDRYIDPSPAVRDAFALFDQMTSTVYSNPDNISRGFLPWPDTVLDSAVNGWKHMRSLQDEGKIFVQRIEDLNRSFKGKNKSLNGKDHWGQECRQPRPGPKWILNRINNYLAVGLFTPSGESLAYILGHLIPEAAGKASDIPILANAFLDSLLDTLDGMESHPSFPSQESFEIVVRHWRNYAESGEGSKAQQEAVGAMFRIKKKMEDLYIRTGLEKFLLNALMYADIVDAIYISNALLVQKNATVTALELFEQWKAEGGVDMNDPNTVSLLRAVIRLFALKPTKEGASSLFDCVMDEGNKASVQEKARIALMEDYLRLLGQTGLYELAQRLMLSLNRQKEGLGNSTFCCNCLMEAYIVAGELNQAEKVFSHMLRSKHSKPDATSWHLVLLACTVPGSPEQVARTKKLLNVLQSTSKDHENIPDTRCYNLALQCFRNAENPESLLEGATKILRKLEGKGNPVKPDSETYLLYMQLQQRACKPKEVFSTLQRFCRLCEDGTVTDQPDARHFNAVLQAYASSEMETGEDRFSKARSILRMMLDACYVFNRMVAEQTDCPAKPDAETYSILLDIFLSTANDKAEADAFDVIQAMVDQYFTRHNFHDSLKLVERVRDFYRENFNTHKTEDMDLRPERYEKINGLLRYLTRMITIRGKERKRRQDDF